MCVNPRKLSVVVLVALAGWCPPALGSVGSADSPVFVIDNRGGEILVSQRAQGIFLAGVPFQNTFKAVVTNWGGGSPGTVRFTLNGSSVDVPYGGDGAETSAFDMGNLPAASCVVTSTMTITAKNSAGTQVAQTSVPLKCINVPWFAPSMSAKPVSPLQWGQDIVYTGCIGVPPICLASFQNLDATWRGENALFKDFGGLFSGGEINAEFNGAEGEYRFEIKADVAMKPRPTLGSVWKPATNRRKISATGDHTLSLSMSASATIGSSSGCFDSGPVICGNGQFGYEWRIVPVGPLFGLPLFFTGTLGFDLGPELCFEPLAFSLLSNPLPLTAADINGNLTGQGGLELGIPYFLSIFGGLEGNASGRVHVLGSPIPTCWDWPLLADLSFDLSIVGYARLGFSEWELGRYVIVQWSCPTGQGMILLPVTPQSPVMQMARRPYLENGEPYAKYEPGPRAGAAIKRNATRSEADELITPNVNLEATPSIAGNGNLTLVATSEDDASFPAFVEHEIQAVFRDGAVWGAKLAVTNNNVPDIQPAAGFDAAGKAIIAWTTIPGTTGTEDLPTLKSMMEIAYSVYDSDTAAWSAPVQLTSNATLDALPQIVNGADGSTSLVWLNSGDNSLPVGPSDPAGSPPAVMVARWNGTSFGTPQVLLASCDTANVVRYARDANGREFLIWTRDTDANLFTVADREVAESHTVGGVWTTPVNLTSNATADTAAALVPSAAGVIAYFVSSGTGGTPDTPLDEMYARVFDGAAWSAPSVQFSTPTILSPSFAKGPTGSVGCVWIGPALTAEGKGVLYATSPTGVGGWGEAQEMAVTAMPTAPACTFASTNLQVTYVSARPAVNAAKLGLSLRDAGSTAFDVRLLDHAPYTDLWVNAADISVSPQPPTASQPATVSGKVHLSGDYPQTGVSMAVYDGDPQQGGGLIGASAVNLVPGGTASVEFPWTYPSDFAQHTLYLVADPDNLVPELQENNNTAQQSIGSLNLAATGVRQAYCNPDSVGVEITLTNQSYANLGNVGYEVRRDSTTGPVLFSGVVPTAAAGQAVTLVLPWDVSLTTAGLYDVFLIVDPSGTVAESEESDNTFSSTVRVMGDLQAEPWSATYDSANAQVVVRNVGAKPMAASIVRATRPSQTLGEAPLAALAAGESATVTIPIMGPLPAGLILLTVNPDSDGSDEVSLLNNAAYAAVAANPDMNCDGVVNADDVPHFAQALLDPAGYAADHPACNALLADMNSDGSANGGDIQSFVDRLLVP